MADERKDENPAEVGGSGADEQSAPGGGSSAVGTAPPDTGEGDQMADANNEYPDVMDMESLPTWKAAIDACIELKAISEGDREYITKAGARNGYGDDSWMAFIQDVNSEECGPSVVLRALEDTPGDGLRVRKAMERFLKALAEIGVLDPSRDPAVANKGRDMYEVIDQPPAKKRRTKGAGKSQPSQQSGLSRLSVALGGTNPMKHAMDAALKTVQTGESIQGDGSEDTLVKVVDIIAGMSGHIISAALGAAQQRAPVPTPTDSGQVPGAHYAPILVPRVSNRLANTPELTFTPDRRTTTGETHETPPDKEPVSGCGAAAMVSETTPGAEHDPGNPSSKPLTMCTPRELGELKVELKAGTHDTLTVVPRVGKPHGTEQRRVQDNQPPPPPPLDAGVVIFCHEQTTWTAVEGGKCDPLVLLVYNAGADWCDRHWKLPRTQVIPEDQGERGAAARAYRTQTNLNPDDLEMAQSARIRPIRHGVRYHAAVYTRPMTEIYASINRHEWGVNGKAGHKAQWIRMSTLNLRKPIPVSLLTVVEQCWGNVTSDFELHSRVAPKTTREKLRLGEQIGREENNSLAVPADTYVRAGNQRSPPEGEAAGSSGERPAVVDLLRTGDGEEKGPGESSDGTTPSPRGSIRTQHKRLLTVDGAGAHSGERAPKVPRNEGYERGSVPGPTPEPSTFYNKEKPAALKPKAGGSPPQGHPSAKERPAVPPLQLHAIPRDPNMELAEMDPADLRRPPRRYTPAGSQEQRASTVSARQDDMRIAGLDRAMRSRNGDIKIRQVKMVYAARISWSANANAVGGQPEAIMCHAADINILTTRSIGASDPWQNPDYKAICKPYNNAEGCNAFRCNDLHACDAFVPVMPQSIMDLGFEKRMMESIPVMYAPCGSLTHQRQDHMRFQDALMRPINRAFAGELWWVLGKPPRICHTGRWAGIADAPDQEARSREPQDATSPDHGDPNL